MESKIQQLTDQLYQEGVAKGKAEQERIVNEANEAAAKILAEAKSQAETIINQANESAKAQIESSNREIALAARQMVSDVKHTLQSAVTAEAVTKEVASSFGDSKFVQELIAEMVKSGLSEGTIKVSSKSEPDIKKFVEAKVAAALTVVADGSLTSGFKVQPKDKGYYISFTDEQFDAMLKEYLRPTLLSVLFGESE